MVEWSATIEAVLVFARHTGEDATVSNDNLSRLAGSRDAAMEVSGRGEEGHQRGMKVAVPEPG